MKKRRRDNDLAIAKRTYLDDTHGGPDMTMIEILHGRSDKNIRALAHFLATAEIPK